MNNTFFRHLQTISYFVIALAAASFCNAEKIHNEKDGLVVIEAENTASELGEWQIKRELGGYKGSGYIHFIGNSHTGGAPNSRLDYHFKINEGGVYVLDVRAAKMLIDDRTDLANDFYVRVMGDYNSLPGRHDIPSHNASLNMLRTDTKFFGGGIDAWEWASGDIKQHNVSEGRLDPGAKANKRKALYHFKAGEVYTLVIHGRSKDFRVDRIAFRKLDRKAGTHSVANAVADADAIDKNGPESAQFEDAIPQAYDTDKVIPFTHFDSESHPQDTQIIAKQNDTFVSHLKNRSWVQFKDFNFGNWSGGSIDTLASSEGALGKVELRLDSPSGKLIGTINIRSTIAEDVWTVFNTNIIPITGKRDLYFVFEAGRDQHFNIKDFVFRAGEFVADKAPSPPVRPPEGRLAYIADGNSTDPDDIGATPVVLALLRATGLDDRLVHLSLNCDLVKARNISEKDEKRRRTMMLEASEGARKLWGGFEGLTFWNSISQQDETVADLTHAINQSSATDPLWIILAGEPDIIGFALQKSDPKKHKFVKMITHHPVNDRSGDFFKFKQMLQFDYDLVRIPDQNGATYASIHEGLQRQLKAFEWLKQVSDPRYHWLWTQIDIAEKDDVVRFQKGKGDVSDAGMVFYWITGANVNHGYELPGIYDLVDLFAEHDKTFSQDVQKMGLTNK